MAVFTDAVGTSVAVKHNQYPGIQVVVGGGPEYFYEHLAAHSYSDSLEAGYIIASATQWTGLSVNHELNALFM